MTSPGRIRLVVLFGGQSAEHEVSCTSAYEVLKALDPARYEIDPVGITRDGAWVRADAAVRSLAEGGLSWPTGRLEATGTEVPPLATVGATGPDGAPTVVVPLVHGTHGEDGTVQGMLELAGVPYVGSGVLGSALCMDKAKAKDVLAAHGFPQVPYVEVRDVEAEQARALVDAAGLGYPVFVKPANLGSSVGVSKVAGPEGLDVAVAVATAYDEFVVIEQAATAPREIEVAVLGDLAPRASVPGEIVTSHEFYDYEDKYLDGTSRAVVPADLPEAVAAEVRALAVEAFTALRCDGMARVDFFYEADGRGVLVNEVNTIPGFTPISMYPQLWAASGLPYPDLLDELVRLALARHERRAHLSTKR
ncbi:MAG: D-alanine--D-alanine ligase family protein [Acidimicrobiia bacterium]